MRLTAPVATGGPGTGRHDAAALAAAALGDAKLPLLVVRRSRRFAGLNLVFGSLCFGLAVAMSWSALQSGENLGGPLLLLVAVTFYGVHAGRQFRDDSPKVVVERAGLSLPGVSDGPVEWTRINGIGLATGLRALGGGHIDVAFDAETFARLKPGQRWLGDPVVKARGPGTTLAILGAPLDTRTKTIFAAMRRHWPPGD